jgi:hypothetical protein
MHTGHTKEARYSQVKPRKNDRAKTPTPMRTPFGVEDERLRAFLKAATMPEATKRGGCYACVYLGIETPRC